MRASAFVDLHTRLLWRSYFEGGGDAVGVTHFKDELTIDDPFTAIGSIERQYDVVWMYVGVVQVKEVGGELDLDAGAYGMGLPEMKPGRDETENEWSIQLQRDFEHPWLHEGNATGFVIAQLRGGKLTGWIDDVKLVSKAD
jgi:hypothetical protein